MQQGLRGFDNKRFKDASLHALQRLQPTWGTLSFEADKEQTLAFIKSSCQNISTLLPGGHWANQTDLNLALPYIDWLSFEWEGLPLELLVLPYSSGASLVCVSSACDKELMLHFVQAIKRFAIRPKGHCLRYADGWDSATDFDEEIGKVSWDDITLPHEMMHQLRESVEGFFAQRDLMREFGFAWRRGILLIGPPGTGKTMVCKAIAAATPELPFLYVQSLSRSSSVPVIFHRARKLAPCVLAFEDLDGFMNDSNRTVFLNEMDGFASNDGLLIIASSNHPGKIDEALLKRPSRFDRVFHLGLPELAERRAFCEKILSRDTLASKLAPGFDSAALSEQVASKSDGFTPAYLKEAFVSAALSRAQEGATVLDERFAKEVIEQLGELKAHLKKVKNPDSMAEMRSSDDAVGFRR